MFEYIYGKEDCRCQFFKVPLILFTNEVFRATFSRRAVLPHSTVRQEAPQEKSLCIIQMFFTQFSHNYHPFFFFFLCVTIKQIQQYGFTC